MKKITGIIAALAVLNGFAFADAKGTEIMTTVADFKKPSFSRSQVIMSLQDKSGAKEDRRLLSTEKKPTAKLTL